MESTEFVVDFVTTAGAVGTDDVFRFDFSPFGRRPLVHLSVCIIHPLRRFAPRPACLRGTVCWRGACGCNYSLPYRGGYGEGS